MGGGAFHAPQLAAGCAAASLTSTARSQVSTSLDRSSGGGQAGGWRLQGRICWCNRPPTQSSEETKNV